MKEIKVVNRRDKKIEGFKYINIMRGSVFGNIFKMRNDSLDERLRVIEEYKKYLWKELNQPESKLGKAVHELANSSEDIALMCCCKPLACHGDVIKAAIEWIRNTIK
jgi:hypothetical protein